MGLFGKMTTTETAPSLDDSPPGMFLLIIQVLDRFFSIFDLPQWRDYMPLGLGDVESNKGWLSHELPLPISTSLPKLTSYQDFLLQQESNESLSFGFKSIYKFAFQTTSTALGDLTTLDGLVALAVMVTILRFIKRALNPLFCQIGRSLARKTHGMEWEKDNEEKIVKFGEYVFRLLYHSTFAIFAIVYLLDKPWWDKSRGGTLNLWDGWPNHEIEVDMTWYYLLQSAYNVDAFISLVELSFEFQLIPLKVSWSPTVRGDFNEMMIHHIITNCLIFGSSFFRFQRIGSMVFMIHDISDVPVDLSKLCNFVKWKISTVACFTTMVIVWVGTRMTILPFTIVKSVWYESDRLVTKGALDARVYKMYFGFFFSLLVGITLLHYFWFTIFIKIARDLLMKGKVHDLSEHKKGEVETKKKV